MNATCNACGKEPGIYHVTVTVSIFGPVRSKTKSVQFWLCTGCEADNQKIMTRDRSLRERVAIALTNVQRLLRYKYGDAPGPLPTYWTRDPKGPE